MDTAYSITFTEGIFQKAIEVNQTKSDALKVDTTSTVTLTENAHLSLTFHGPAKSRLYMDLLVDTKLPYKEDDEGYYLEPQDAPYILYKYDDKTSYPFTVGYYIAYYQAPNERKHYFGLKVGSKLYEESHACMVADIEAYMDSLSYEGTKKMLITEAQQSTQYAEKYAHRYIDSLREIAAYPFEKITYQYVLSYQQHHADFRTTQYALTHPMEKRYYVPEKRRERHTLENAWLKHFVKQNMQQLKQLLGKASEPKKIQQLIRASRQFLQLDWVQDIAYPSEPLMPAVFQQHPAYTAIFQMYRQLRKHSTAPAYGQVRLYKQSAALYEMWTYLYVIRHFEQRGFEKVHDNLDVKRVDHGVSFNEQYTNYVELKHGDNTVRIFLEHKITNNIIDDVSMLMPLATLAPKNYPDIRIDFWQGPHYKGSHIIDAKYSNIERRYEEEKNTLLVKPDPTIGTKKPKTIEQLMAYALETQTCTAHLSPQSNRFIDRVPVEEVWAIYPFYNVSDELRLNTFRFMSVTPNRPNTLFHQHLERITNEKF